jgi:hypothetical protein
MIDFYRVSLSPKFNTYLSRKELEDTLNSVGLIHLMTSESGNRRAFHRTMKQIEKDHGLKFKVIKESNRDIMWEVRKGTRTLGVFMLTYGERGPRKLPGWLGSRSRSINKARFPEDKVTFDQIVKELNECLQNPGVNGYTIHLKVLELLKSTADVIESRPTGVRSDLQEKQSAYYIMSHEYLPVLKNLEIVYEKFDMKITIEPLEQETN